MTNPHPDQPTRFRLRLEDSQITLIEGNSYELPFFLDNLSNDVLSLGISLSGFPAGWISLPIPPVIQLQPGQSRLVSVNISLADQGSDLAGHYQGNLQISDQGNPNLIQTEPVELIVVSRQVQNRFTIALEFAGRSSFPWQPGQSAYSPQQFWKHATIPGNNLPRHPWQLDLNPKPGRST